MAQMNPLPLICLVLAAGAAPARAQGAAAEHFAPGRFAFVAPSSATVTRRTDSGAASVRVAVRYGLYFDVGSYAWWAHYFSGTPATAREYVQTDTQLQPLDFRLVEPPKQIEFAGYPAWAYTYSYTIRKRLAKAEIHITESYLVVQRRWGYTVIEYKTDSEFFAENKPKFDAFLADIKLLPEPPGGPWLLAVLSAALVAIGAWAYRRRKGVSAGLKGGA